MGVTLAMMRKGQQALQEKRMKNGRRELYAAAVREQNNIPYLPDGAEEHLLDVIRPAGTEGPLPVILEVHGGGLVTCFKEVNTLHSRYYATKGYAVVNTNYTLMPEGSFTTAMRELAAALCWVADNAAEYGFDTGRVYVSGDSAGGMLVTLLAAVLHSETLQRGFGVTPPPFRVKGWAATCPMVGTGQLTKPEDNTHRLFAKALGKGFFTDTEMLRLADLYQMPEDCAYPDIFIVTTPEDDLLYAQSKELHEYLTGRGIACHYREYTGAANKLEHVFNVLWPEWAESVQANDDILAYFAEMAGR